SSETSASPTDHLPAKSKGDREPSVPPPPPPPPLSLECLRQHRTLLLQWCFVNAKARHAFQQQQRVALVSSFFRLLFSPPLSLEQTTAPLLHRSPANLVESLEPTSGAQQGAVAAAAPDTAATAPQQTWHRR